MKNRDLLARVVAETKARQERDRARHYRLENERLRLQLRLARKQARAWRDRARSHRKELREAHRRLSAWREVTMKGANSDDV